MATETQPRETVSVEDRSLAEGHKATANDFFKNGDYDNAIEFYSKALELDGTNAVYYANRSLAYIRTECFGYALNDAAKSISIDPNYVKAYYRRASANMALGKFKQALKDFETVVKVRPNDRDAKAKFTECQKIVYKMQFERAIAVEDNKSVVDSIDIDSMTIEDSYAGPKLTPPTGDDVTEDLSPGARIGITRQFIIDLMEHYKNQKVLHRKYAYLILREAKDFFSKLPSLVDIPVPPKSESSMKQQKFTICGDIHGQFYDLMNIFELNGIPSPDNPYLFNGDFVDRGSFSVECIFTLLSFKLLYPKHFYMSRGNHESATMNQMYGFEGEVKAKYTSQMANLFTEVFNWIPLCHLISSRILVMHGGLFSEDNVTVDQLRQISRNRQPPDNGLMCELLWSDPQPIPGRSPSKRGVGIHFGPDVTNNFCQVNSLDYIVRSHEVKVEGYEVDHGGKCITVFSAPNYCDTMGNRGAFITITGDDFSPKFTSFKEVPHPNVRPMAYANSLLSFLA